MKTVFSNIILILISTVTVYLMTSFINGRERSSIEIIDSIDTGKDIVIKSDGGNDLIDVEKYIAGVLPGIISWDSSDRLIEAQAVAVRTKIYYVMGDSSAINSEQLGYKYYTEEEWQKKLGREGYNKYREKYHRAVINTKGKIN